MAAKKNINIEVELDEQNVPVDIRWQADDSSTDEAISCRSMVLSLWDHQKKDTLRLDLWTKDMPVEEMKGFSINILGGMADTLLRATNDEYMAQEIHQLCEKLALYLKESQQNT